MSAAKVIFSFSENTGIIGLRTMISAEERNLSHQIEDILWSDILPGRKEETNAAKCSEFRSME